MSELEIHSPCLARPEHPVLEFSPPSLVFVIFLKNINRPTLPPTGREPCGFFPPALSLLPPVAALSACQLARPLAAHSQQRLATPSRRSGVPYCELARASEVSALVLHHLQRLDQLRPTATIKPSAFQIPLVPFQGPSRGDYFLSDVRMIFVSGRFLWPGPNLELN